MHYMYKSIWVFACFVMLMSQYAAEPVLRMRKNNRWVYLMHTSDRPVLQTLIILNHALNFKKSLKKKNL